MRTSIPPALFSPQSLPAAPDLGQDPLDIARASLLVPAGLDEDGVARIVGDVMGHAVDYADVYFQMIREESWALEDGIVKDGAHSIDQGVGVRALAGEKTGFAYSDEVVLPALLEAAHAARAIARSGTAGALQAWRARGGHRLYLPIDPVETLDDRDKVRLLEEIDRATRALDPRITQVMASLSASHDTILVLASDGTLAADVRPLVRLKRFRDHRAGRPARAGLRGWRRTFCVHRVPRVATLAGTGPRSGTHGAGELEAVPAPAGTMTVVLGSGWPGVLLHEAVGHGLEGDFNRKGTSAFTGRMGQQVAARGVTVVDDGTLPARRGSLNIDDEGTPTQCTTLIEDGVLRGYLQDKLNARLMGVVPTGNGRRESFAHVTMPRMTNTYMLPGSHAPEEIIASVSQGLYCRSFGGGQVDITSGKFVFSASEAYLIEDGKITAPVKGATLIGNGPDVMTRISMVGSDLKLDDGVGTCGKEGQDVPVGVGQPTLRVDGLTVGGTA